MSKATDHENDRTFVSAPPIASAVAGCLPVTHVSANITITEKNPLSQKFRAYSCEAPPIGAAIDGCLPVVSKETLGISFTEQAPQAQQAHIVLPPPKK